MQLHPLTRQAIIVNMNMIKMPWKKNTTSLDHYLNNFDRPCFTAACFRHSTLRGCFKSVCQSSCTRCMPSLLPARAEVHHAPVEQGRGAWKTAANVHTASAARITESRHLGPRRLIRRRIVHQVALNHHHVDALTVAPMIDLNYVPFPVHQIGCRTCDARS